MRKSLAVLAVLVAVLAAGAVSAADHLVTAQAAQARLSEAEAARQHDLAVIGGALATPEAAAAARAVGANLEDLRGATAALSDADLRDLARRSAALQADPVAGVSDNDIRWMLYIFLIVAIVILVIKAVD